MSSTEIIDDLIVLGRACPEKLRDGRDTVCTAGYSYRLGFIRLYPTTIHMKWKRWDIVKVLVERDSRDTRWESRKIAGAKTEWDSLHERVEILGTLSTDERSSLIAHLVDECVQVISDQVYCPK